MSDRDTIVVWFSCGAASAVAAKLTIDKYKTTHNIRVVNNPVVNEHPDNIRFLKDVESWLGITIESCINVKYPSCDIRDVFEKRKYISGVRGAPCTLELKKQARYDFESNNKIDWHVLGFTKDEEKRAIRFKQGERQNLIPILIENNLSKDDCFRILEAENIRLPEIYKLGYPNANCIGCVKSQSPTYWNLVRDTFPEIFAERALQSRRIGAKLVKIKGKRAFLDELTPNDRGGRIKSWDCGIFCDKD